MKKLLFSLFAIMVFVACTDSGSDDGGGNSNNDQPKVPEITLDATAVNFTTDGGSTVVTFTSSDAWTAEAINNRADAWCSVSPTSGSAGNSQVTITTTANDTTDDRTATVVIKSGTIQKTIAVSQKQKDALTVTSSKFEVSADGGEIEIKVKANIDFNVEIDESAKSWVTHRSTRAMKTSTLLFEVDENSDSEKRKANITITSGKLRETITIYQESNKPSIVLTQNEYTVPSAGETIAVEVKSNVDVTVEMPKDAGWITENTTRATSTNTYYFDIETNNEYDARTAKIKFTNKENNLSETITITQAQKDAIVIAEDSYTLPKEGGEIEIELEHSVEFDIKIDGDWIAQKQTRALETSKLTFVVAENTTYKAREGSITFTSKNGAVSQKIQVTQNVTLCELYYTSSNGKIVTPENTYWGGAKIISNVYENDRGVITFDGDITSIGNDAFINCSSLTSIVIPESVKSIGELAFFNCSSLTSIVIPDGVVSIGSSAFEGCVCLASVNIPEGVTKIENFTFSVCRSLTSIVIPESVESIGRWAFSSCKSLTSIVIPDGVESIGSYAFMYCSSLASVYCKPTTPPMLGDSAFSYNASGRKIYVSTTSINAYKTANGWKDYARYIVCDNPNEPETVPNNQIWYTSTDGKIITPHKTDVFGANIISNIYENGKGVIKFDGDVTEIGIDAFWWCYDLTSITIPNGVTSIEEEAFYYCPSLSSVTIPNSVTSIGESAFSRCSSLTSITIPNSVTSIGESAFYNCSSLTYVTIPNSVTSIESYAFEGCSSLTSVTIPNSVSSIGESAFYTCI